MVILAPSLTVTFKRANKRPSKCNQNNFNPWRAIKWKHLYHLRISSNGFTRVYETQRRSSWDTRPSSLLRFSVRSALYALHKPRPSWHKMVSQLALNASLIFYFLAKIVLLALMAFWNLVILVLRGLWSANNYREHFVDPQFTLHLKSWLPSTIMTLGTLIPGHVESYFMPCSQPRCLLVAIYSTSLSNWKLLKVRILKIFPILRYFIIAKLLYSAIKLIFSTNCTSEYIRNGNSSDSRNIII